MKEAFSKLLLALLITSNILTVELVNEIGKPLNHQPQDMTQELLQSIRHKLPVETADYYKYYDHQEKQAYKYLLNEDYSITKDVGISKTTQTGFKLKPFDPLDSSIKEKTKTTTHKKINYYSKRVYSNQFEKLRMKALSTVVAYGCVGIILPALISTSILLNKEISANEKITTLGCSAAIATIVSAYNAIRYIKLSLVKEIDYLKRRALSDKYEYHECDDLSREF